MSVMCGIDQIKTLGPFRANRLMGCAPGVKTWAPPGDLRAFCEALTETDCGKLFFAKTAAELSGVAGE